ncbi:hypothetical protein [uncultured Desulfobacter sp.]|uniref:hypothetical protein n=1 Tax=uncultured Desulfobacter sp. TaxID=240139 RepID=UPI002AAB3E06|nr:hypothetical protein [uncultured Desulfobacter sp.]
MLVDGGNTGNNITTQEAVAAVENEIEKATPVREASRKVAESTGMNDGSLRVAHQRAEKKMNSAKLSKLQRFILVEAYKHGEIQNADILMRWYSFQPVSHEKIKFNRKQISMKK